MIKEWPRSFEDIARASEFMGPRPVVDHPCSTSIKPVALADVGERGFEFYEIKVCPEARDETEELLDGAGSLW